MLRQVFTLRRLLVVLITVLLLGASSSRASAQTPEWRAQDMAVDNSGYTRVMWRHTPTGRIVLWRVNPSGEVITGVAHGEATSGWRGEAIAVGPDGKTRAIWNNDNGTVAVWTATAEGQYENVRFYGPYNDGNGLTWKAIDIAVGGDNRIHVLFKRTDGIASLQVIDPAQFGNSQYASDSAVRLTSPAGAMPKAISVDLQGRTRLMWQWQQNGSGMLMWVVNPGDSTPSIQYSDGPFVGWMPMDQAAPGDGTTHTFWDSTVDGAISLRVLATSGPYYFNYGPQTGWRAKSISYYRTGGNGRLMLNNDDGRMALWNLTPNGSYANQTWVFNFGSTMASLLIPQGLTAMDDTNSVVLKWNPVDGATHYLIYRSTSSTGTYSQIASRTVTEYIDEFDAGSWGIKYWYKVAAVVNGETKAQSGPVSGTPSQPPTLIVSSPDVRQIIYTGCPPGSSCSYTPPTLAFTVSLSRPTRFPTTCTATTAEFRFAALWGDDKQARKGHPGSGGDGSDFGEAMHEVEVVPDKIRDVPGYKGPGKQWVFPAYSQEAVTVRVPYAGDEGFEDEEFFALRVNVSTAIYTWTFDPTANLNTYPYSDGYRTAPGVCTLISLPNSNPVFGPPFTYRPQGRRKSIYLNWLRVSAANFYEIYSSSTPDVRWGPPYVPLAVVGNNEWNSPDFLHQNLGDGQTVYYRVVAVRNGERAAYDVVSGTTAAALNPPSIPTARLFKDREAPLRTHKAG